MQKTVSVINLNNLRRNALFVRGILKGRKFYAVVKADGYGHGGAEVARAVEDIADGFCVAIVDEGVRLRLAGIVKPIIVLTPPLDFDDIARIRLYDLTPSVNSVKTAKLISGTPCHIQVNTGMNRLGCNITELPKLLKTLSREQIVGVYSHMYNPSSAEDSDAQLRLFNSAEELVKCKNPNAIAHLAASGGLLSGDKYLKDGGRCGILLYGYPPEGFKAAVKPVLTVYARRTQITKFIGGGAGYARANRTYKNLGCYRLGYADGFMRTVPLGENNLCMDAFLKEGGGEYERVLSDAAEYAKRCGTIAYEVLCSATRRSLKIYEG